LAERGAFKLPLSSVKAFREEHTLSNANQNSMSFVLDLTELLFGI
jgi:hypothetical protein